MLRRLLDARHRKATLLVVLVLVAGGSLAAPSRFSDPLKHVAQLLVPFQQPLYHRAWATSAGLQAFLGGAPVAEAVAARRDAAMENMAVSLTHQLERLRDENSRLRGLRERYVPPGIRLVSAAVVTRGISAARDTLLLSRGAGLDAQPALRTGDAVASRLFLNTGTETGTAVGHLVVAREFLLGEIDQVSPFVSRVRLFSDPGARTLVRIGRVVEGRGGARFVAVDYPCTVVGRGRGDMVIEHVPRKLVASPDGRAGDNQIALGDLVCSASGAAPLTRAMTMGYVESVENEPRQPLVVTIHVRPALRADEIDEVLVLAGRGE